jgi:hypothetical protein
MSRNRISPPLRLPFNRVYEAMSAQPKRRTPELQTTGGVSFVAEAKSTTDGRQFISLPHKNRIYEHDWGYSSNSMGRDGQRIGHYSQPIDEWATLARF